MTKYYRKHDFLYIEDETGVFEIDMSSLSVEFCFKTHPVINWKARATEIKKRTFMGYYRHCMKLNKYLPKL